MTSRLSDPNRVARRQDDHDKGPGTTAEASSFQARHPQRTIPNLLCSSTCRTWSSAVGRIACHPSQPDGLPVVAHPARQLVASGAIIETVNLFIDPVPFTQRVEEAGATRDSSARRPAPYTRARMPRSTSAPAPAAASQRPAGAQPSEGGGHAATPS